MKLKLNTAGLGTTAPDAANTAASAKPANKISLKLGKPTASASATAGTAVNTTPKSAAKKPGNKRAREDDTPFGSASKKAKTGKPTLLRLKTSKSQAGTPKTPIAHLNIKTKGKVPVRPLGVGYDSEAEDAEEDPSIEENIILRMKPGTDCDLLRKAVEERRLGAKPEENGVRMAMRFFGKDGRRASVSVADSHYGAVLVDLPTITESMKSWDRRGWWKSADICQMLLVLDRIQAPEDAKTMALPPELDQKTWQWPHGLTPPMHNVRKRRFRKRVSYRTIEAAEQEVERLLAEDEKAIKHGGHIEHEVIDLDELREQEEMDSDEDEYDEPDAEGDVDDSQLMIQQDDDEEDEEAAAARLALELGADDDDELAANGESTVASGQAAPVAEAASSLAAPLASVEGTSPAAGTTSGDNDEEEQEDGADDDEAEEEEEEEDSGDDEEESDEEQDDDARQEAQQKQQQLEDIAQLERSILQQRQNLNNVTSAIFRTRIASQIKVLEAERDVKRRAAGLDDEDG